MSAANVWKRLGGELLAAVDRDFERAALIPCRAFWPALIKPQGLAHYDRAGADLVAFKQDGALEVVIQCKGFFKAEGLQDDQFGAFEKSIDAFERSGLVTETFVVLHNQDSRNQLVAGKIDDALERLISVKRAQRVIQWDRPAFLRALEARLRGMVAERLGEQSALMLAQLDRQFAHGGAYVPDVPVRHQKLRLRRGHKPQIDAVGKHARQTNIAEALTQAKYPWTLLTGLFGSGKTSAALHAARLAPQQILYVHAGSIEPRYGEGGTNSLMARIVETLSIFGDFEADERALFERLAGPVLRQLLSADETDALLILDALDENRTLGTPEAITRFASALSELRSPIIMTTREEHFRATFGNFDHLFDELSMKSGTVREVALLALEPWTNAEVIDFVAAAAAEEPDNPHLRSLRDALLRGEDGGWGQEFLRHPFFLRMIVDLTAEGSDPAASRSELIGSWVWSKLVRDLKTARSTPVEVHDRNSFIERMEGMMAEIAGEMVEQDKDGVRLLDTIGSARVVAICENIFETQGLDLGRAISVSLLIPTAVRHRGEVPVRFTHRAFQEYFLAGRLLDAGIDPEPYPESVRAFRAELPLDRPREDPNGKA